MGAEIRCGPTTAYPIDGPHALHLAVHNVAGGEVVALQLGRLPVQQRHVLEMDVGLVDA